MALFIPTPKLKALFRFNFPAALGFMALLWLLSAVQPSFQTLASPPADPKFRDFNGVNHMVGSDINEKLGIGWVRQDFGWWAIEKEKGQWSWDETDKLVQAAHAENVQILPTLFHTPAWAQSAAKANTAPPDNVQDWEDFVEHVVARYSAAPYNLKYFQVWNEPTRQAGFFTGRTNTDYVDLIYIPAAKIIRRHSCYVVFGGWPQSNSLDELDQLLTHQNAWQLTDIIDIHYRNVPDWQHLYDKWVKTGKCRGLWQTEVNLDSGHANFLPSLYLSSLHWALGTELRDPDQYKLFWFSSWGAGKDAAYCLTTTGPDDKIVLTPHGNRLAVLNSLLGGGDLANFTAFATSVPPNGTTFNAFGFRVGQSRIVIALFPQKAAFIRQPSVQVSVSMAGQPRQTQLVTASGARQPLPPNYSGGRLQVTVPLQPVLNDCPSCAGAVAYVDIGQ